MERRVRRQGESLKRRPAVEPSAKQTIRPAQQKQPAHGRHEPIPHGHENMPGYFLG